MLLLESLRKAVSPPSARAGWVSVLLLESLQNEASPPGARGRTSTPTSAWLNWYAEECQSPNSWPAVSQPSADTFRPAPGSAARPKRWSALSCLPEISSLWFRSADTFRPAAGSVHLEPFPSVSLLPHVRPVAQFLYSAVSLPFQTRLDMSHNTSLRRRGRRS